MTVLGHAAPFRATKTLATAMRWLAIRVAVYAVAAIGVTAVFVGGSAFYAFVWPAPPVVTRSAPDLQNVRRPPTTSTREETRKPTPALQASPSDDAMRPASRPSNSGPASPPELSYEQQRVVRSLLRQSGKMPLKQVDFAIAVGARIPPGIASDTVPAKVLSISPKWQGYEFLLVQDDVVILNPRSREIMAVFIDKPRS